MMDPLKPLDSFLHRHLGPRDHEIPGMLETVGFASLDALMDATVPAAIRMEGDLGGAVQPALSESEALADLKDKVSRNQPHRSYIGMGYYGTIVPPVIQRNVLENPGWYTQYTPYQAEISQGRLEALLNFQTMCSELTGLDIANASLLDEGTAAAEAMTLCLRSAKKRKGQRFFVDKYLNPQTIEVVSTRAKPLDIEIVLGSPEEFDFDRRLGPTMPGIFDFDRRPKLRKHVNILCWCTLHRQAPGEFDSTSVPTPKRWVSLLSTAGLH